MKKNTLKHIFALAAGLMIALGCVEEPVPVETPAASGEECILTFNFGHSEPIEVQTRSEVAHKYESQVHNFYLFVFDKDGNKVFGKYFDSETLCSSIDELTSNYDNCWYVDNATSNDSSSADYKTTGTVRMKVSSGEGMKIYMLANADADMVKVSSDLLSSTIGNEKDLLNFNVYMNQTTVERNGYFPMSGVITGVSITGSTDGTTTSVSTITDKKLELKRIDAKVKFIFKTGTRPDEKGQVISKFEPISWQVLNVPRTTYAMGYAERGVTDATSGKDIVSVDPTTPYSQYSKYAADFFDSDPLTFEDYTSSTESGFTFYMMENRQTPKKNAGNYQDRSLRKKISSGVNAQMNEECTVNYVVNGKSYERTMRCFEYANDFSTYVLVRGHVTMGLENDAAGSTLGADVNYIIHLGNWNSTISDTYGNDKYTNIDDYNTIRNTSYTYTVTVNSVNNIRVEVESSNPETGEATVIENQPGAYGDVTIAKEEIALCDAHYVSKTLDFKLKNFFEGGNITEEHKITDQLTWNIKTPFAEGEPRIEGDIDITEGLDYKWVHFRLNKKNDDGTYSSARRKYVDREFATSTTKRSASQNAEGDGTDGLAGYHNDGIMDVEHLVNYIKEQVDLYLDPNTRSACDFDSTSDADGGPKISVTVFVDEYYYDKNPLTGESDPTLWKKFVNADDRYLHILCDSKKSKDMESSATGSVVTIQQHAIQCIYNTDESNTGLTTAWGVEYTDEFEKGLQEMNSDGKYTKSPYCSSTDKAISVNRGNSDQYNGLINTAKEWGLCNASSTSFNTGKSWGTYMALEVNNETPQLNDDYRYLRYSCMTRNRDNNGNGVIDREEVRWYMASVQQLIGLFVGKNLLTKSTQLYNRSPEDKAESDLAYWQQHVVSSTNFKNNSNNPTIIWAEEGISTSENNPEWNKVSDYETVRCVRNLGYLDGKSDESYGLDKTPQNYITTTTTSDGVIYDAANLNTAATRYYTSKELPFHSETDIENMVYRKFEMHSELHSLSSSVYFQGFNDTVEEAIAKGNSLCPDGYRIPNQVELAVGVYFGDQTSYAFSRTYFSFGPIGTKDVKEENKTKYGFQCQGNINVDHDNGLFATYRCVRDIRVDD